MKTIILAVLFAAVALASWFYNGELTVWGTLVALLPGMFLLQSISLSKSIRRAWGKATPDFAKSKAGMGTKISVWSYISSTAILPYLWIAAFTMIGILPIATIIVFLTLPVAIACSRTMFKLLDGATGLQSDLPNRTTSLAYMLSTLLALALLIGKFI